MSKTKLTADEKEVNEILQRVINYFLRIGWDDFSYGAGELSESLNQLSKEM